MRNTLSLQFGSVVLMSLVGAPTPPSYISTMVYNPDLYPNTFEVLYEDPFTDNETVYDSNTAQFVDGTVFFLNTSYNVAWTTSNSIAVSSSFVIQSWALYDNYLAKEDELNTFQTVYSTANHAMIGRRLYTNVGLTQSVSAASGVFAQSYGTFGTSSTGEISSTPAPVLVTPCYTTHAETATTYNVQTVDLIRSNLNSSYVFYDQALSLPVSANFSHNGTYYSVDPANGRITNYVTNPPVTNRFGWPPDGTGVSITLGFATDDDTLAVGVYVYDTSGGNYSTPWANTLFADTNGGTTGYLTDANGQITRLLYQVSNIYSDCLMNTPLSVWNESSPIGLPNSGLYGGNGQLFTGSAIYAGNIYTYTDGNLSTTEACPT